MLCVLEGVDGAGKTTLAEELRERLQAQGAPCMILHRGPPQSHALNEYELALDTYVPGGGLHIICDRWHVGADVYGPLKRGNTHLTDEARWHIEMYLISRGAVLVLVEPPNPGALLRRLRTRGETYVTEEEALWCLGEFRRVTARSHLPTLVHKSGVDDPQRILDTAGRLEETAARFTGHPTYIGPPRPRVLLLGERRSSRISPGAEGHFDAAFAPFSAGSGSYLLRALGDATDVGVANACESAVRDLWLELRQPVVVALGGAAQQACAAEGVPHRKARHPQYMRRFHHGELERYGQELRCES